MVWLLSLTAPMSMSTFGGGGHSREILNRLGENGRLYAFDQDADALNNTIDDPRFYPYSSKFLST